MWIPYIVEAILWRYHTIAVLIQDISRSYSIFIYYNQLINSTVKQNQFQLKTKNQNNLVHYVQNTIL